MDLVMLAFSFTVLHGWMNLAIPLTYVGLFYFTISFTRFIRENINN